MDLDLETLTETERDAVIAVLRRDESLRRKENERVRKLRNEVKRIKLKGVIKAGHDPDKTCARCRAPFGWLFNKGTLCAKCQHRVCDNCRVNDAIKGTICILCFKQKELEKTSGQWFYSKFRKSKRSKKTNKVITGNEIVRATFKKAESDYHDERGSILRGNASPRSQRSLDGESSDTQSMEVTMSPNLRRSPRNNNKNGDASSLHSKSSQEGRKTPKQASSKTDSMSSDSDDNGTSKMMAGIKFEKHVSKEKSGSRSPSPPTNDANEQDQLDGDDEPTPKAREVNSEDKKSISSQPHLTVTKNIAKQGHAHTQSQSSTHTSASESQDDENLDDIFASHGSTLQAPSMTGSLSSHYRANLLSPFSESRESIVSYYSEAGEGNYGNIPITGEIQFGLDYNYKTGQLLISIKSCKDIAPVDTKKKRSDPYVKTYLLPDKTKNGKRKTRAKKHTLNPVFDEVLRYPITKSELETRTLWISVWHNDTFGRNDFLGEVTIPLDYYEFKNTQPVWHKLQERDQLKNTAMRERTESTDTLTNTSAPSLLTYKGDLIFSLKYVTTDHLGSKKKSGGKAQQRGELQVLVKEARNLTAMRANGTSDPFCKGYLLPDKTHKAKQKTGVVKRDCNPQWNHTFVFEDLALEDLRERALELTVWDHDRFTSNDFLGGLRLNLGLGTSAAKEVDWMDARGEEISVWQDMLEHPNNWVDASLMLRPNMASNK